ncbi:MAG TPA: hypothetical protein VFS43_43620 [Polyangiaceae bacterium]|nr:hypothetical protein [Polyangiaceae bacterium]
MGRRPLLSFVSSPRRAPRAAPWLVAAAALASAGAARAGEAPPRVGATVRDGGGCEAQAGGGCRALAPGAPLDRERDFVAGERGAVLELRGGGVARLAPRARVRVSSTLDVPLGGGPPTPAPTLRFDEGAARIAVGEAVAGRTAVVVRLPRGRSAVVARGTTSLRAEGGRAFVGALEGEALVSPDGKAWCRLPEGQARRFDGDAPRGERLALLGAPAWQTSTTLTTDLHAKRSPLRLAWSGAPGASGYELVVRRKGEGAPALVKRLPEGAGSVAIGDLPAGAYVATLWPLDAAQLEGRASRPLELRVVGVELPAGAAANREGLIRLGPRQEVRLRYADGLEASPGVSAPFGPAPAAVGLDDRGPKLVRLRAPGGADVSELLIARRALRAEVEVGPRTATWPSVPLDVRVRLVDQDGTPAPDDTLATPLVTLGLRPVAARWERVGNELRASLDPEPLAGPSVVRVEVLDERGALAGRNFVEIVPDKAAGGGRLATRAAP